jgi:hypothetical protein
MKIRRSQNAVRNIPLSGWTTEPPRAGDCKGVLPEFGRTEDVERIFGIKRGTLYNLFEQKKIRSVLLRIKGSKSGVRLWHLESIQEYLMEAMAQEEQQTTQEQNTLNE